MLKRQWIMLAILVIGYIFFFLNVQYCKPSGEASNFFWKTKTVKTIRRSYKDIGYKWIHQPNYPSVFLVWLTITGVGGAIIWGLREKKKDT